MNPKAPPVPLSALNQHLYCERRAYLRRANASPRASERGAD